MEAKKNAAATGSYLDTEEIQQKIDSVNADIAEEQASELTHVKLQSRTFKCLLLLNLQKIVRLHLSSSFLSAQ